MATGMSDATRITPRVTTAAIPAGAIVPCWSCGTLPDVKIGDNTLCCICDSCRAKLAAALAKVAEMSRAEELHRG